MKLLGISKSTLNRRAEDGTIPSELEEGRKRGRKYPKEAIDAHVKLLKRKENAKLTFGLATNSELWASYQNHFRLYEPEDIVTYERLLEWREANYDIFMSAREGEKRIAGVTMIPLDEDVILSLINGEIREQNIRPISIREWAEKNLTIYISSISIHHTGYAQKDRDIGSRHLLYYQRTLTSTEERSTKPSVPISSYSCALSWTNPSMNLGAKSTRAS